MTLGGVILIGLIVGEIIALAKIRRQNRRIMKLEEEAGIATKAKKK